MPSNLHVLVYGNVEQGICDTFRFGMHVGPLLAHGVELRPLTRIEYATTQTDGSLVDAAADEDFTLDRSALDWADVVVFRRFYQTVWNCSACPHNDADRAVMEVHAKATGHPLQPPDPLVRPLLAAIRRDPDLLRGRAVVYETDDDLLDIKAWNGLRRRMAPERDLVEQMIRRADLVTTTTPVLAARLARYNDAVRVVRNAIDTRWYERPADMPDVEGDPRVLYYGLAIRYRDYAIARDAIDRAKALVPDLRRVWLGATDAPVVGGWNSEIAACSDELLPFATGVRAFAQAITRAQPHIGVAPLVGDEFDRAKSELHWLEYSMAGAATIATRTMGAGPFDVIRDGVDGILVRRRAEWREAVLRVARSRTLREELAGRARERVMAEYDVRVRATEWAAAYRWAAEHAGRGARDRLFPVAWSQHDIGAHGLRTLDHRMAERQRMERSAQRLVDLRGGRPACWSETASPPLVSVLIPVTDEGPDLVARAVRSVLSQAHRPLEVIVAGADVNPAVVSAVESFGPEVRWLPVGPLPWRAPDRVAGRAALSAAIAAAAAAAAGSWIAPLSPEGEFLPGHIDTLLEVARDHLLEFVYGHSRIEFGQDAALLLGDWPPGPDGVLTLGSEILAAPLLAIEPYDAESWRIGETPGWSLWRRLAAAGVRMANIDTPVHRLAPLEADGTGAAADSGVVADSCAGGASAHHPAPAA